MSYVAARNLSGWPESAGAEQSDGESAVPQACVEQNL